MKTWSVVRLSPVRAGATTPDDVAAGRSIIVVDEFASDAECESLRAAAMECSSAERAGGNPVAARLRLHVPKRLDAAAQALSDELVRRALAFTEVELPALAAAVGPREALRFADFEPAVNVYSAGGEFRPHEDGQALTVLLPLPGDYEGGGTAFWSEEDRGPSLARGGKDPTCVLQPPAGSALLFGGGVTHAGRPVASGTRCVYVASFSAASDADAGRARRDEHPGRPAGADAESGDGVSGLSEADLAPLF